jgi:hypothetical protein
LIHYTPPYSAYPKEFWSSSGSELGLCSTSGCPRIAGPLYARCLCYQRLVGPLDSSLHPHMPTLVDLSACEYFHRSCQGLAKLSANSGSYLTGSYQASFVLSLSLITSNTGGQTKKMIVSGMIWFGACIGNIAGVSSPLIDTRKETSLTFLYSPSFTRRNRPPNITSASALYLWPTASSFAYSSYSVMSSYTRTERRKNSGRVTCPVRRN